jgi:glutathionyl-hydroquinone reductase
MLRTVPTPGFADTVNSEHIRKYYYTSHRTINPNGSKFHLDRPVFSYSSK